MSVRKNEQSTSRFEVLDVVLKLVNYTCQILSNDKIFIPRYQKMIDQMCDETRLIYHYCKVANKIDMRVKDEDLFEANKQQRLDLERRALILCEDLHTDIMNGKELTKMPTIKRNKMGIKEAKMMENLMANTEKLQAFMDYVAACDYPEILEEEYTVESGNESEVNADE